MIELQQLTKVFPNGKGIFDVTLTVREGEVFGFLGPNGAGKSTTIRHLLGFLKPTKGRAAIKGFDCWRESVRVQALIGYLPGEIAFPEGMTGMEFLDLLAGMRRMNTTRYRDELIERLQLDVRLPIRKMSKGTKQKVGLVAALMHDPEVIILDEPTSGLDPLMQQTFIDLIREEKQKGKTIFLSSHIFLEIERTCDRVAIMKDGRLIAVNDVHELQSMQRKLFDVILSREEDVAKLLASPLEVVHHAGRRVCIAVQGNYDAFIRELAQYKVQSLDIHAQSLEDIFLHYYDRRGDER
ncbi:ABC transporter ATP-binding protein [Geobacillus sp. BMUD]|uniref:ABC transporter ATP-binding protein n=1 Tax=Geobacillus sp. BMUD TaxID=2508876 RepID=UPI001490FF93|nr:ABC transporter ATP-binding protein [Geobacillus sp. BMUD]NNU82893.1 ABC transporter ATP-binding protein [Geobacillus sp. BMUD]